MSEKHKDILERARELLKQKRSDALDSIEYIKSKEKKAAFLRKVNYELSIYQQLINAIETGATAPEKEEDESCLEESEQPLSVPKATKKRSNISIRGYAFMYGKEAARAESIFRAETYYNF